MGASKEAALYFDRVFPDDLVTYAAFQVSGGELRSGAHFSDLNVPIRRKEMEPIVTSLMPNVRDSVDRIYRYNQLLTAELLIKIWEIGDLEVKPPQEILENADRNVGLPFEIGDLNGDWGGAIDRLAKERQRIVQSCGFDKAPGWVNSDFFGEFEDGPKGNEDSFLVAMQGLELVDASKLSWEQICEFRKDKDAQRALRDLRIFFSERLDGKDPEYIIDKLNQLQDENSRIAKLWNFETATQGFGVAFEEKSLGAFGIGLMATMLAGAPLPAIAAAALVVPAGRFGLKVAEVGLQAARSKNSNPVKYLTLVERLKAQ